MPRDGTARSPKPGSSPLSLPSGERLEAQVAQLWFWEGFYARAGVDLQRHFEREPLTITDLDLLAFDLNPQLARSKYIGEVKSGTGKNAAKPLDRVIWLRGLRELVGATSAELTIAHAPSDRVRELSHSLGITAQSTYDFERREQEIVGGRADFGSHGVSALTTTKEVQKICRGDSELERSFWFLRSEVWFLDPFLALKQLIELMRRLVQRWTPRYEDDDTRGVRWLLAEGVSVFTLNLVTIAGYSLRLSRNDFNGLVAGRLAEGALPKHQMRYLSEQVDKYVAGVLAATNAPPDVRVEALGAFLPTAPEYAEQIAEAAWRLGQSPHAARSLPRQVDALIFERLVRSREPGEAPATRLGLSRDDGFGLRRLIAGLLRGCQASTALVDDALQAPVQAPSRSGEAEVQQPELFNGDDNAARPTSGVESEDD